jgi:catechol 2,3-dioxygenase-like lactoylglutathione lyase family enzyme
MRGTGLCHIALKTHDAQKSATFYEKGLGFHRLQEQAEGHLVILVDPDRGDVMTISTGNVGAEVDKTSIADIGRSGGIDHFGYCLAEGVTLKDAVAGLVALGGQEGHWVKFAGIDSVFVTDLDGYVFQLWEYPGPVPKHIAR